MDFQARFCDRNKEAATSEHSAEGPLRLKGAKASQAGVASTQDEDAKGCSAPINTTSLIHAPRPKLSPEMTFARHELGTSLALRTGTLHSTSLQCAGSGGWNMKGRTTCHLRIDARTCLPFLLEDIGFHSSGQRQVRARTAVLLHSGRCSSSSIQGVVP